MTKFNVFVIRLVASGVFAVLVCRMFFKEVTVLKVMGLGALFLGLAYVFEYARRTDTGGKDEK